MSPSPPTFTTPFAISSGDHVKPARDSLLFPSYSGAHLRESVVCKRWNAAGKVVGRPDLRVHDLRHTGATLAAQAGSAIAELQARLVHTTSGAAMIYQHAAKGRDRHLARELSRLAAGN